eukprot:s419_g4.t1
MTVKKLGNRRSLAISKIELAMICFMLQQVELVMKDANLTTPFGVNRLWLPLSNAKRPQSGALTARLPQIEIIRGV